jgi:hypothetical protein
MTDQPPVIFTVMVSLMWFAVFLTGMALLAGLVCLMAEKPDEPEDDGHPPDDFPEFPDFPTGPGVEEEELTCV